MGNKVAGYFQFNGLQGRSCSYRKLIPQLAPLMAAGKAARPLLLIDIEPNEKLNGLLASLAETGLSSEQGFTVICFGLRCLDKVRASSLANAEIKYAEDYLSPEEFEEIDRQAYKWIRNWYRLECLSEYESSLCYRDILLGSLVEHPLGFDLPQFLKKVKMIKNILAQEQSSVILLFTTDDDLEQVVQLMGRTVNCPMINAGSINTRHSYLPIIKRISRVVGLSFDTLIFMGDMLGSKIHRRKTQKKLIFIEDYDRLYPILDTLREKGGKRIMVLGSSGGTLNRLVALRKRRLYRALLHHLNPSAINRVRKAKRRMIRAWQDIQNNVDFCNYFDYEGLNLWPIIEQKFAHVFKSLFPQMIGLIESANQGLAFYHPSLVVLNADFTPNGRAICVIAKQMGLPTLVIQHGVYGTYLAGYDIIYADKLAAWGKSQVNSYTALGNDSSKVEVVGGYLFDKLYYRSKQRDREGNAKERICQQLGLDFKSGIFTFATTATSKKGGFLSAYQADDNGELVLRQIIEMMKEFPEKQLVVKLHPMEDEVVYGRVLDEMPRERERARVVKQIDLHDLIDASEIILTGPSTVALEAIIMDKPVVITQLIKGQNIALCTRYPALNVWQQDDITPAIKSTLDDPETRQSLAKQRVKFLSEEGEYLVDGKSTERIINLIDNMASEKTK